MTHDKEEYLFTTYAPLFEPEEIRNDCRTSCMAWGFEVGDGWYPLIEDMLKSLMAVNTEGNYVVQIRQIKEKFGGLRVYWDCTSDITEADYKRLNDIVDKAEELAEQTCEVCGAEGKNDSPTSWMSTRCALHRKELNG
jgi:hypothetical protein